METEYIVFWGLCSGAVVTSIFYRGLQQRKTNKILKDIYELILKKELFEKYTSKLEKKI